MNSVRAGLIFLLLSPSYSLAESTWTTSVRINGGAPSTASEAVTLTLRAEFAGITATQMQFSKDLVTWYGWETFNPTRNATLLDPAANGTKWIHARFKDAAGRQSPVASASIILDKTWTGAIRINAGAATTNTEAATLSLQAIHGSLAATHMRFSKDNVEWFGWEEFKTTRPVTLLNRMEDGTKTVYVQFRDASGNLSPVFLDTIQLVRPWTCTMKINRGDLSTAVAPAELMIESRHGIVTATSMQFSKDLITWYGWEPFSTTRAVTLLEPSVPGGKSWVHARFKDPDGVVSPQICSASIVFDKTWSGEALLNNGAATTRSELATVSLQASHGTRAITQMRFSKDRITWFDWETFATARTVTLVSPPVIHVQFRDSAGNVSPTYSDTITVERTSGGLARDFFGGHINQEVVWFKPDGSCNTDFLRKAGVLGIIRLWDTKTTWRDLQPAALPFSETEGVRRLDRLVDCAAEAGLKVIYTLGQAPKWAWPANYATRAAATSPAAAAAEHLRVWNYGWYIDYWRNDTLYSAGDQVVATCNGQRGLYASDRNDNGTDPCMGGWTQLPYEFNPAELGTRASYAPWVPEESHWRRYVQFVASRHAGRIAYYEIWNEPNMVTFFRGTPEELAALTVQAAEEIRKADPAAKIISASPAWLTDSCDVNSPDAQDPYVPTVRCLHPLTSYQYLKRYLAMLTTKTPMPIDRVGVHTYVNPLQPEAISPRFAGKPATIPTGELDRISATTHTALGDFSRALQDSGVRLPLWVTEIGYVSFMRGSRYTEIPDKGTTPRDQAAEISASYLLRTWLAHWLEGVDQVSLYTLDSFGFRITRDVAIHAQSTEQEQRIIAYNDMQYILPRSIRWLSGAMNPGYRKLGSNHVLRFEKVDNARYLLVWTADSVSSSFDLGSVFPPATHSGLKTVDLRTGAIRALSGSTLTISSTPVLLTDSSGLLAAETLNPPLGAIYPYTFAVSSVVKGSGSNPLHDVTIGIAPSVAGTPNQCNGTAGLLVQYQKSGMEGSTSWEPCRTPRTVRMDFGALPCSTLRMRTIDPTGNLSDWFSRSISSTGQQCQ